MDTQEDWRNFLNDPQMEGTYIDLFKQDHGLVVKKKEYKLYAQDWSAYNEAQTSEMTLFNRLLRDLVESVAEPEYRFGRPRLSLREVLFCAIQKVYSQLSSRRVHSFYKNAVGEGLIEKAPYETEKSA